MKRGYKILLLGLIMESYVLFANLIEYIIYSQYCGIDRLCVSIPITPYTSLVQYLADIILPITLCGIAVLIVGLVIVFWDRRKNSTSEPTVDTMKKSTDVLSS